MEFEWDRRKAERNPRKHGVSFVSVGHSSLGRLLVVGYTERGSKIRLIFARRATMPERVDYEEA